MHKFFCLASWFVPAMGAWLAVSSWAAPPEWLDDPANSRWLLLGGTNGIVEAQGVSARADSEEGKLVPGTQAGVAGAKALSASGKSGYFYLLAEPWDLFRVWLGEDRDVQLVLRYFDAAPGRLRIQYDSSDPRVKSEHYAAGVWRKPEAFPEGIPLKGDQQWKTVSLRLPFAFFTKRCHGADFRLDVLSDDFLLAGVALVRVPRNQDPDLRVQQEVRVERVSGFESFGRGARFAGRFRQAGNAPVVMEAELATQLTLQGGHVPGFDALASGGAYLHYVESAQWEFEVQTAGTYVMWQRSFFPWKGGWNHEERLDAESSRMITDGTRTPEEGWQWIRAGTYQLAAGAHTFRLSYHGGARLDLLVLTVGNAAPELANLRSSYHGALTGEVWTSAVRPLDVAGWRGARFAVQGATAAEYRYSTDGGTTWAGFDPATFAWDKVVTAGGGRDALQFHLKLAGTAPVPPLYAGATVTYLAGANNTRTVENSRMRLTVDTSGLRSLFDKSANREVGRAAVLHAALASLTVKKPGSAPTAVLDLYDGVLEAIDTTGTPEQPVLAMQHRLANGMRLTTQVTLLASGQSEWRLTIDNPTEFEVAEIRFPVLTGLKLGGTPDDDWIAMFRCWGQVWKNPAAAGRLSTFWGPSMRWTALWDTHQGLYLGIEDERLDDYGFVYGGDSSGGATLAPCQRILVKPHSNWQSAVYRVALTAGDWHAAADIYRDYAGRTLKPCEVPPYVKWLVDGWGHQASDRMPTHGWDVIDGSLPVLMAANRQMTDGADSGYCGLYPFPGLVWGSTREFSQKLAFRRALGGTYTPYHNFHLWSPGYGHYPRIGSFPKARLPADAPKPDDDWYRRASEYSYDGNYPRLETDYFAQLGMAMPSREWRDWLADWTRRYLDWGADGMYYDQFNMIYPNGRLYEDYPDTYGSWTRATLDTIARIKTAGRRKNPFYTASGEVCNDLYGQYLDLHMTSGVFNRLDLYQYCNPGQLLIDGGWNGGLSERFGGAERWRFIWQVGARFEGVPADSRFLSLRRAVKSLLYDAQFMDTVGLTVCDAQGRAVEPEDSFADNCQNGPYRGVIGRWFRYRQGAARGAVVNLINAPVQKNCSVRFDARDIGPVQLALAWTADGRVTVLPGRQDGDEYVFPVPESEMASVVLSAGVPPVVEWALDPVAAPGTVRGLKLQVTNANAAPLSGEAELLLPAKWKRQAAVPFGPIAPGDHGTFSLPVEIPAGAKPARYDVRCELRTPTGRFTTYSFVSVNSPVLADFRGNPGGYHVWLRNLTGLAYKGTARFAAPAGTTVTGPAEFALPPEGELMLPVSVTGQERLREIAEMGASIRVAGETSELVRAVLPGVPNGDFETDSAGDRKPDWWMCRKVRDEWSYERMHLAAGARNGRYCLQLDPPQAGESLICAYPVHGVLKPGVRYRFRVWIKSESTDGVYANVLGAQVGKGKTGPEWQEFTRDFTAPPGGAILSRALINASPTPAWFDDLSVEELPAPAALR